MRDLLVYSRNRIPSTRGKCQDCGNGMSSSEPPFHAMPMAALPGYSPQPALRRGTGADTSVQVSVRPGSLLAAASSPSHLPFFPRSSRAHSWAEVPFAGR